MIMYKKICDRCGELITRTYSNYLYKIETYKVGKVGKDIDLCDECLDSLNVWITTKPVVQPQPQQKLFGW